MTSPSIKIKGFKTADGFKFMNISAHWTKTGILYKMGFVLLEKNKNSAIQILSITDLMLKVFFLKQIKYTNCRPRGIIIPIDSIKSLKEIFDLLELIKIELYFYYFDRKDEEERYRFMFTSSNFQTISKEEYLEKANGHFNI